MKPEALLETRKIQEVEANSPAEIIAQEGGDVLVRMHNDRGPFEVLATADRAKCFLDAATRESRLSLSGFFLRRSGFRQSGERHFVWRLVLLSHRVPDGAMA